MVSRLFDTILNRQMQNAYKSKSNEERITDGHDKLNKHLVIMGMFVAALVLNLYVVVFEPNINNEHLVHISLKYCNI